MKTDESRERGDADQQPSHSPLTTSRERERESEREMKRSEEANEAAPVQSQHCRHKSWFCTISSKRS